MVGGLLPSSLPVPMIPGRLHHRILPSPIGDIALLWSADRDGAFVRRVLLPTEEMPVVPMLGEGFRDSTIGTCPEMERLGAEITAFLEGAPVRFSLEHVALDQCGVFQRSVLLAEYGIPRGSISTYQRIAGHLGRPKGARAVGNSLARNPFPLIIPCHRAIRSDMTLGGFQGGLNVKRRLLELEGIRFDPAGRVVASRMHY